MSSLPVLINQKAELWAEFAQQFGEVTDEQVIVAQELDMAVKVKVDAWALFLKEDIPEQVLKLKERIKEYQEGIKKLELFKEKKELYLHNLLKGNNLEEINGEEKRIVADVSVRRSVDADKEIEDEYIMVKFDPISFKDYQILSDYLQAEETTTEGIEAYDRVVAQLLVHATQVFPTVTQLPEDHPAIVKSIRPTVKVLKVKK